MKTILSLAAAFAVASLTCFDASASSEDVSQSAISQSYSNSLMTWGTAGSEQFSGFIGDVFSLKSASGDSADLKLLEVISHPSGPDRPDHLGRKEGVTIVFDPSGFEWLKVPGGQIVDVWHHELGSERVFVSVIPTRDGGFTVEIPLN